MSKIDGDPVSIAFNARYMVEALQNMEAERLAIEPQRPAFAWRPEARGRPRLRPRHHAGAYAVLSLDRWRPRSRGPRPRDGRPDRRLSAPSH